MVVEQDIFHYINDDEMAVFEQAPLESIAKEGKLQAYKHDGFWQCMDTQRDKIILENMWNTGNAPWKIWDCQVKCVN